MNTQKIYKNSFGYYQFRKEDLLKKGYQITEDTDKYTVFIGVNLADKIKEQVQYQELIRNY